MSSTLTLSSMQFTSISAWQHSWSTFAGRHGTSFLQLASFPTVPTNALLLCRSTAAISGVICEQNLMICGGL